MRRVPRWLVFTLVVLVLASGALASVSVGTVRQSFPEVDGRVDVAGLSGNVEVLRDEYGVPQIYADNAEDLFAGPGLRARPGPLLRDGLPTTPRRRAALGAVRRVPGRDRRLRPDPGLAPGRRAGAGAARPVDPALSRRVRRRCQRLPERPLGRGPVAGVHACSGCRVWTTTREPWTAVDSLAWLKVMAWDLGSNLEQETERAIVTGASARPERPRCSRPIHCDGPRADRRPRHGRGQASIPTLAGGPARPLTGFGPWPSRPARAGVLARCTGSTPAGPSCCGSRGRGRRDRAPTPGWWPGPGPPAAGRCWPTTRTWPPRCRRSSPRSACTAGCGHRTARSTSPDSAWPRCPGW